MRDLSILFIHLIVTAAKLLRPGGGRAVVAESLLLKHQLVVLNRGRDRAPNLRPMDRLIAGLCTLFVRPVRLLRIAVVLKPSTLLAFHAALVKRKYHRLFSPKRRGKPGPEGPPPELIAAIVEIKRRNPSWGCRRIAQQICLVFELEIDKDVVRRVLAKHYRTDPGSYGPPGYQYSVMRKTACGVSICFAANPSFSRAIGCSSSWISAHDELLVSAYTRAQWMGHHFVGCSTVRSAGPVPQNTSAAIMILYSDSIDGKLTFEYSR